MKKIITGIIVALVILINLSVLLYPTVSDYVNSLNQSRVVAHYFDDMTGMDDETRQAMLEAAHEYNKNLLLKAGRFEFSDDEMAAYKKQLDTGRGVMGILFIDKIGVKLPIYHGTDEGVLQVGIGHMPGTSLPVGGTGTHAFITGHRGLPSAKLLTDLDQMTEGDIFALYVLGETLTYQVDDIKTIKPDDKDALGIDPNQDYCTLVTCTPYGINTHRLLVRGHRIPNANTDWSTPYASAKKLDKIIIVLMFLVLLLPLVIIYLIIKCVKIHKGGRIYQ